MNVEGKDCGLEPPTCARCRSSTAGCWDGCSTRSTTSREPRHLSVRPRGEGALRVRLGRILRLVSRVREGPAAARRRRQRRRRRARHAVRARARARGDAAPRASVHPVHHRGAVAERRAARGKVRRDDLAAAVSEGELRHRRRRRGARDGAPEGARRRVPRAAQRDGAVAGAARAAARRRRAGAARSASRRISRTLAKVSKVDDRRRASAHRRAGARRRRHAT